MMIAIIAAAIVLPAVAFVAVTALRTIFSGPPPAGAPGATALPPGALSLSQLSGWKGRERVNVLVMGIDQRPNEDANIARSDSMILLTLDPVAKTAGMLSIPRDLYVPLPGRNTQDRINVAHALGGPKYAMQTVEYNLGIPVQYYVRLNFSAVIKLIDLVGGIDVFNDEDINDLSYPDMNFGYDPFKLKAGWQHLDGATALKYARTRHGSSDFARMRRQQQVILALRDKASDPGTMTRLLPQAPQILQTLKDSLESNLTPLELAQLATLAREVPAEKISKVTIDESATQYWTTPQGASVLIPNRDKVRELRDQLYATSEVTVPQGTPEAGKLVVQNGTQTKGLAANAQGLLQQKGFTVVRVENAVGDYKKTTIIDYHGRKAYIQQLAATLGVPLSAVVSKLEPSNPLDALVILGDDYVSR
ncbi:MAG: LCP family protein [Thermoflexales bacterium]|nr:LCP family protein [Thermoflexales bacterium]